MKSVDILFMYEHVARELDVACAIQYYLQTRHSLTVELVQQPYGVPEAIQRWSPKLVVVPFIYSNSLKHYPFLLDWRRSIFVNAMWEQLSYPGNRAAKIPLGTFETQHVIHHAWGQATREMLLECQVPARNIFLNGHMAYTLYDPPYNSFFDDRAALANHFGLDPSKRWVFFPENYNWAFYEDWRLRDLAKAGLERDTMDEMARFCRNSLTQVMQWCNTFANAHDLELIVRPRPSTPLADFTREISRIIPNKSAHIHILKDGTVREWILASDVVLSSHSTTLIEAAIAEKPAFMLEPLPMPSSLHSAWHAYLPHLSNQREFNDACLGIYPQDERLGHWARQTMMAHGDSILNFANHLAGLVRGQAPRPPVPTRSDIVTKHPNSTKNAIEFELLRMRERDKRTQTPGRRVSVYESDVLEGQPLEQRRAHWAQVLNESHPAPSLSPQPSLTPA